MILICLSVLGSGTLAYFTDSAAIAQSDMIAFLQANADYRIRESLSDCTAKALVLVGGKERPIMKRSAGMIAQALPGAVLEECRGLGHGALSLNHPQQYAEKLLHLLRQDSEQENCALLYAFNVAILIGRNSKYLPMRLCLQELL